MFTPELNSNEENKKYALKWIRSIKKKFWGKNFSQNVDAD